MAVDVGVNVPSSERPLLERIDLTGRIATKLIPVEREPAFIAIDPDTWLLMDAGAFVKRP